MPSEIENFDEAQYTHEFVTSLYDEGYFLRNYRDKRTQNLNTARILKEHFNFNSVVDFGCGIGTYLELFKNFGCEVRGFDYGYTFAKDLYERVGLKEDEVSFGDVTKDIPLTKKYDVAMSIEVAEHIPCSKSDTLVSNLVNATDNMIFFSAAGKGQGGLGHINCQDMVEFWYPKFMDRGWVLYPDSLSLLEKMNPVDKPSKDPSSVWSWVYSNLRVFIKK